MKCLLAMFTKESKTVSFTDVALLASLCEALVVTHFEDTIADVNDFSDFSRDLLECHLPKMLFDRLNTLKFCTFEERMFIPASLNLVSTLVECARTKDLPDSNMTLSLIISTLILFPNKVTFCGTEG